MSSVERDRRAFELAKEYLLQFESAGVTLELIEKYLHPHRLRPKPTTISEIYERILWSAQTANMKAGVIGRAIDGVKNLDRVLCDFQPKKVLEKYPDWEQVLAEIERVLQPRGKIRKSQRSVWPQFCKTILSAARFMARFDTADDFYAWADSFGEDDGTRADLALFLSREIHGLGFALACDFLKELGYVDFAKPDVHLRDIFTGLNLCPTDADDIQIFKAIARVATSVGVTPYSIDKLFWLVGSGNFHEDLQVGHNGRIGTDKREFIADARERLNVRSQTDEG